MAAPAPKDIRIVVGLGNPGAEYEHTRHNAGFATVDVLASRHGARYWKSECGCQVARIRIGGREVILAMPQDFMNTSGGPVSKLLRKER
ncbi:MAG: aminoacyl-tRNA hydrolase, partial [Atopobiaceae bacterium]|nr:aminoacyl-tRNA hydrolase [Atopobiaceae bacterium]